MLVVLRLTVLQLHDQNTLTFPIIIGYEAQFSRHRKYTRASVPKVVTLYSTPTCHSASCAEQQKKRKMRPIEREGVERRGSLRGMGGATWKRPCAVALCTRRAGSGGSRSRARTPRLARGPAICDAGLARFARTCRLWQWLRVGRMRHQSENEKGSGWRDCTKASRDRSMMPMLSSFSVVVVR